MTDARVPIAVFASGSGSNLGALLSHFDALGDRRAGDVVLVASDRDSAAALARARERGITAAVLRNFRDGDEILHLLTGVGVRMVVLAGYLRLLPAAVVAAYPQRVLNVHPAPLPRFGGTGMYGRRVHEAVLAAGGTHSAVSIHFVDEEYDRGAIIAQWPVPIEPGDSAESLARRVLATEHVVYPRVIDMVAALLPPRI
jgi:phosphoribosylglycinamide formyltransferase 1